MKRLTFAIAALVIGVATSAHAQRPSNPFLSANQPQPPTVAQPGDSQPVPMGHQAPALGPVHGGAGDLVPEVSGPISMGQLTPTPSMWFYEQERRDYHNPQMAVRAKAEMRTAQRMQRLAALKWFGFSNSRPTAAVTPTHSTSAPHWSSNTYDPYRWSGVGRPSVVLVPGSYSYR